MKILGFTGSRAEYYLQRPVLNRLDSLSSVSVALIVCGSILEEDSQITLSDIEKDGIPIAAKIPISRADKSQSHALQIADLIHKIDPVIEEYKPDCSLVYADRYESFAFALAAFHRDLVVVHMEAGDITEGGTYDDNIRHCITKLSHLQLTSTVKCLQVLESLGEESWRSRRVGLFSYETINSIPIDSARKVVDSLGLPQDVPLVIATMHPIPIDIEATIHECTEFMEGLADASSKTKLGIIVTGPNRDQGSQYIENIIHSYCPRINNCQFIENLGGLRYHSLLSLAKVRSVIVCGNSSSVIKEAPFFGAHGLNVGRRQLGRERADTQVDVEADRSKISQSIVKMAAQACSVSYNPYLGDEPSRDAVEFILDAFNRKSTAELLSKKWAPIR
jgi:UDP-hydrolysing UDP-N-acetyl-D-glucosamine 2-epimerase